MSNFCLLKFVRGSGFSSRARFLRGRFRALVRACVRLWYGTIPRNLFFCSRLCRRRKLCTSTILKFFMLDSMVPYSYRISNPWYVTEALQSSSEYPIHSELAISAVKCTLTVWYHTWYKLSSKLLAALDVVHMSRESRWFLLLCWPHAMQICRKNLKLGRQTVKTFG